MNELTNYQYIINIFNFGRNIIRWVKIPLFNYHNDILELCMSNI